MYDAQRTVAVTILQRSSPPCPSQVSAALKGSSLPLPPLGPAPCLTPSPHSPFKRKTCSNFLLQCCLFSFTYSALWIQPSRLSLGLEPAVLRDTAFCSPLFSVLFPGKRRMCLPLVCLDGMGVEVNRASGDRKWRLPKPPPDWMSLEVDKGSIHLCDSSTRRRAQHMVGVQKMFAKPQAKPGSWAPGRIPATVNLPKHPAPNLGDVIHRTESVLRSNFRM